VWAPACDADERIGVTGKRFVDRIPVFARQILVCERNDFVLLRAHVLPVELRGIVDGRGELEKSRSPPF
jgi:hypothetical protein